MSGLTDAERRGARILAVLLVLGTLTDLVRARFPQWGRLPPSPPASVAPEPTATSPKEAVLRIQVQPPARILIDKNDFGERRTLVQGVTGGSSHLISVLPVRAGYTRKDTTVTPRPGDTVTVHIRLEGGP